MRTLLPPVAEDEAYAALQAELVRAASFWLTSVQDASADDPSGGRVAADERSRREGTLTVRVRVAVPLERDVTAARLAEYVALR